MGAFKPQTTVVKYSWCDSSQDKRKSDNVQALKICYFVNKVIVMPDRQDKFSENFK